MNRALTRLTVPFPGPPLQVLTTYTLKPQIRDDSEGSWRRIKLVPFTRRFGPEEMDRELRNRLKRKLPGILAWAVKGCLEWQVRGLEEPEEVQKATADYQQWRPGSRRLLPVDTAVHTTVVSATSSFTCFSLASGM